MTTQRNWAGNITYSTERVFTPETWEQVQALVADCPRLRVLGTRHSFNRIADSEEALLSLAHLNRIVGLDRERGTVTVEGGVRYGELGQFLHQNGYALPNLASLPHISVAGACATATHGSGDGNRCLAAAVTELEMVTVSGELVTLSHDNNGAAFAGMVVALGGLGVVTRLTLAVEPTFAVRQTVYENLPLAGLEPHFDAITGGAYSTSLFTDWRDARFTQVWRKQRVANTAQSPLARQKPESEWFGATLATRPLHPIAGISAENCTPQQGLPGPWHERLPHFRLEYTPSSGDELQSEYLVPRQHALAALDALNRLRERIAPLLLISEVRTIAGDALWLSPFYERDSVALHFTWRPDWPAVQSLLPHVEERLAPFEARPHWGKLFTMPPARLQSLYPKRQAFLELLDTYDPQHKFRNAFLDTYLDA